MHGAHFVKFVTDQETPGTLESYPALVEGHHDPGSTIPVLYAFIGSRVETQHGPDGAGVPHGGADQGDTWY